MNELPTREQIASERRRLRRKYRELYDEIRRILFEHDPIHIGYREDEYEPEVAMILPRIAACRTEAELTDAVHAVFVEMFSVEDAGEPGRFAPIAKDIWRVASAWSAARTSA